MKPPSNQIINFRLNFIKKILSICIISLIASCSSDKKNYSSLLKSLPNVIAPKLNETRAIELVNLSLKCVDKKFPYKIGYLFNDPRWIKPHYEVTPSFYG